MQECVSSLHEDASQQTLARCESLKNDAFSIVDNNIRVIPTVSPMINLNISYVDEKDVEPVSYTISTASFYNASILLEMIISSNYKFLENVIRNDMGYKARGGKLSRLILDSLDEDKTKISKLKEKFNELKQILKECVDTFQAEKKRINSLPGKGITLPGVSTATDKTLDSFEGVHAKHVTTLLHALEGVVEFYELFYRNERIFNSRMLLFFDAHKDKLVVDKGTQKGNTAALYEDIKEKVRECLTKLFKQTDKLKERQFGPFLRNEIPVTITKQLAVLYSYIRTKTIDYPCERVLQKVSELIQRYESLKTEVSQIKESGGDYTQDTEKISNIFSREDVIRLPDETRNLLDSRSQLDEKDNIRIIENMLSVYGYATEAGPDIEENNGNSSVKKHSRIFYDSKTVYHGVIQKYFTYLNYVYKTILRTDILDSLITSEKSNEDTAVNTTSLPYLEIEFQRDDDNRSELIITIKIRQNVDNPWKVLGKCTVADGVELVELIKKCSAVENNSAEKYPENEELCKEFLKMVLRNVDFEAILAKTAADVLRREESEDIATRDVVFIGFINFVMKIFSEASEMETLPIEKRNHGPLSLLFSNNGLKRIGDKPDSILRSRSAIKDSKVEKKNSQMFQYILIIGFSLFGLLVAGFMTYLMVSKSK